MKTLRVLLLFAAVIALNSCAVEEETPDRTLLLTQKTWTYDSMSGVDEFSKALLEIFVTGSTFKFNTDGTVDYTLLGISDETNWEFNSDQTKITMYAGTDSEQTLDIITLSETTFTFINAEAYGATAKLTYK